MSFERKPKTKSEIKNIIMRYINTFKINIKQSIKVISNRQHILKINLRGITIKTFANTL